MSEPALKKQKQEQTNNGRATAEQLIDCVLTHTCRQFMSDDGNEAYGAFLEKHGIEDNFCTELNCYEEIKVQLTQDTFEAGKQDCHALWAKVSRSENGESSDEDGEDDNDEEDGAADFSSILPEHVSSPDCHTRVGDQTVGEFATDHGLTEEDTAELEEILCEHCDSTGSTDEIFLEKIG
jgi:hypothetical protein